MLFYILNSLVTIACLQPDPPLPDLLTRPLLRPPFPRLGTPLFLFSNSWFTSPYPLDPPQPDPPLPPGTPNILLFDQVHHKLGCTAKDLVRGLKSWTLGIEVLYYLCSENKGADQLRVTAKLICVFVFTYANVGFP